MKVYAQPRNEATVDDGSNLNYTTTQTLYAWPKIHQRILGDVGTVSNKEYFSIPDVEPDNLTIPVKDTSNVVVGYRSTPVIFEAPFIDNLESETAHRTVNVYDIRGNNELIGVRNNLGVYVPTIPSEEGSYYICGYWYYLTSGSAVLDGNAYKTILTDTINNAHVKGYGRTRATSTQRLYCRYASYSNGNGGKWVTPRMSESERLRGPYHDNSTTDGNIVWVNGGGKLQNYISQGPTTMEGHFNNAGNLFNKIVYPNYSLVFATKQIDNIAYTFEGVFVLGGQ